MKRLLKALLVITMLFGFTITTEAVAPETAKLVKKVTGDGARPAEDFNFEVSGAVIDGNLTEAPSIATDGEFTIPIPAGTGPATGEYEFSLDNFNTVGRYEYTIKEIAPTPPTAGMEYDTTEVVLVVLVTLEDGELVRTVGMVKADSEEKSFDLTIAENEYNAYDLTIQKILDGNFVNDDDVFEITVVLDAGNKLFDDSKMESTNHKTRTKSGNIITLTYEITGEGTRTITNVPKGVEFTVEETNATDFNPHYIVSTENVEGTIEAAVTAKITNYRNRGIETGVTLDNMPYLLALTFAVGGLGYVMVRRRKEH